MAVRPATGMFGNTVVVYPGKDTVAVYVPFVSPLKYAMPHASVGIVAAYPVRVSTTFAAESSALALSTTRMGMVVLVGVPTVAAIDSVAPGRSSRGFSGQIS